MKNERNWSGIDMNGMVIGYDIDFGASLHRIITEKKDSCNFRNRNKKEQDIFYRYSSNFHSNSFLLFSFSSKLLNT